MNIVSFFAPRPEHPFFRDYTPFLDLLRLSCERFGHQHLVLTDDPIVGAPVPGRKRSGMTTEEIEAENRGPIGVQHVPPAAGPIVSDAYVTPLPRSLMKATIAAQLAYLDDPQFANVPTLFTGADCVLARDPTQIDTRGVELVITIDDRFQDCRMNCGAIFIPRPKAVRWVWREALKRCGDDWGDDQTSLYSVIDEMRHNWLHVRELPCDPYNLAPDHPGDDCTRGTVLHFRGPRKDWMVNYCHHWLGLGGGVNAQALPNMTVEDALKNVRVNAARGCPWVSVIPPHQKHAVLVGGGPSLVDCLDDIRRRKEDGQLIFGLNGAAKYLLDAGIEADFGVILDGRSENARFICQTRGGWLLASRCAPEVFDAAGEDATVWHFADPGIMEALPVERRDEAPLMCGGIVVGLTAMALAFTMGFRNLHLYGYDSSDRAGAAHSYKQGETTAEMKRVKAWCDGQEFTCGFAMYAQAQAFEGWARRLAELGTIITVHGDGLLPTIARAMQRADMEQDTAA